MARLLLLGSFHTLAEADVLSVRDDTQAWGERYVSGLDEFWLVEMQGVSEAAAAFLAEDYIHQGVNRGRLWQLDAMRAVPNPIRTGLAAGEVFVINMPGQTHAKDDTWFDGRNVIGVADWTAVRGAITRRDSVIEPTDQTTHGTPGGNLGGLDL
jgi:hypothetical protein